MAEGLVEPLHRVLERYAYCKTIQEQATGDLKHSGGDKDIKSAYHLAKEETQRARAAVANALIEFAPQLIQDYYQSNRPVREIGEALGVNWRSITHLMPQVSTDRRCKCCESSFTEVASSRSEWRLQDQRTPFCSIECRAGSRKPKPPRDRRHSLRNMPYQDYLQTTEWQERRQAALGRAGHACQLDASHTENLQVHHRTYERRGEELPDDLTVLCRECHKKHHGIDQPEPKAPRPPPTLWPTWNGLAVIASHRRRAAVSGYMRFELRRARDGELAA